MTETELRHALEEARSERPWLPKPDAKLLARLQPKATLAFADLLLAEGCARGDARCLAELEKHVFPDVKKAIAKIDPSPAFVDEALQAVRERLLAGSTPRIRQYSGEGSLSSWARVAAARIALNLRRGKVGEPRESLAQVAAPISAASPELALMREHLAEKLEVALADAMAALTAEDRNLLRLHLIDGVSLEKIGTMMGVHKSTLSRRLGKLQAELVSGTREALKVRFGIRARELASAMKVFSTRMNVDVAKLLTPPE